MYINLLFRNKDTPLIGLGLTLMTLCMHECLVAQSCPSPCDPMDHSPPGFSVHGILQGRILEWVAILSVGDLPDPGVTCASSYVSCIGRLVLLPPGKPFDFNTSLKTVSKIRFLSTGS